MSYGAAATSSLTLTQLMRAFNKSCAGNKTMPFIDLKKAASFWPNLADTLFVPRTDAECNRLVAVLDKLTDEVGEDESHPLASLMEVIGALVAHYENANVPELGLPLPIQIYRDVLTFIVSNPSAQEIAEFKATPEMHERLKHLVAREHANEITAIEKTELDEYMQIEHFVVMLKSNNLRFINEAREEKV